MERVNVLLEEGEWIVAVGRFDPLTAAQAKRLSALKSQGGKLLAIVLEDQGALLPGAARATLIAALRDVDAVAVSASESWRAALPMHNRVRLVEDKQAEEARSAEFERYIVGRQAVAANGQRGS